MMFFRKSLCRHFLVLLFTFIFPVIGFSTGENTGSYPVTTASETGVNPLGSFQAGDIDLVNLQNGSLVINIPLLKLDGRGQDMAISLIYNSRFWMGSTPNESSFQWDKDVKKDFLPYGWQLNIPKFYSTY